jgi:hypothetical protein
MSFNVLGDLNWLAVIVAAIAFFVLGGIWYAQPVFGRTWQRAGGVEVPEGQRPGPAFYIIPFIVNLLVTIATAMVAAATGTDTLGEGIVLGVVLGLGYAVALSLFGVFENKPAVGTWLTINAAYQFVGVMLISIIVALWH